MSFHSQTMEPSAINEIKPRVSSMSKHASVDHKRVAKMLGYSLTLGSVDGWWGLCQVIEKRLSCSERAALALMALKALPPDDMALVVQQVANQSTMPDPPLLGHMDQAAFWADMASSEELDAYCLASFQSMELSRQSDFLSYVSERQAA
jgi:hypothetical protein